MGARTFQNWVWLLGGVLILLICAVELRAQTVAKVISVTEQATVQRGLKRFAVTNGLDLQVGDRLRTNATGVVQIAFFDRSRMAIAPKSSARIEDVQRATSATARRLAIRALGGSYRFLTGDSPREAYEMQSRTGTIGVRGTEFDFTAKDRRFIAVAKFSGVVAITNNFGRTVTLTGGGDCTAVSLNGNDISVPGNAGELGTLLAQEFPFVADQGQLAPSLQVDLQPCPPLPDRVAPRSIQTRFGQVNDGEAGSSVAAPQSETAPAATVAAAVAAVAPSTTSTPAPVAAAAAPVAAAAPPAAAATAAATAATVAGGGTPTVSGPVRGGGGVESETEDGL